MLSNLKEKLLNVNLFTGSEERISGSKEVVDVNAGAEILQHYQKLWEDVHKLNAENAEEADRIAEEIDALSRKVSLHKQNLEILTYILSSSNLILNIESCLSIIKELFNKSESIESDLVELESMIDEIGFENLKNHHSYQLDQYLQRKEESFQKCKIRLKENHSKKIAEYETNKALVLKERRKVFQDAFKTDMELYKSTGIVPESIRKQNQNSALLEEIQIDYDENELDEFFNENK